jgi:Ca2+:H+ antiporter
MENEAGASKHLFSTSKKVEWALIGLLGLVPIAFGADLVHVDPAVVFLLAAVAVVPLSALLGRATEEYAVRAGPAMGGLLNATFGNAVELIIALFAVSAGLTEIVKASITGSIVANLLLVLGMAMLAGGLKHKTQRLHRRGTMTSLSLMTMSVIALALPALFYWTTTEPTLFASGAPTLSNEEARARLQLLSLIVAVVMMSVYVLSLVYSLFTHKALFHEEVPEEEAEWSKRRALGVMTLSTLGVALMAEVLVGSVHGLTATLKLKDLFVGVVIVAIIGNAAEHSTAVLVALKNKMDLAFQIAAGSSAQIALFVAPAIVFYSFIIGKPMELAFEVFELFSIAMAVAIAYAVSIDEETNWFEGAMLIGVYAIICAVFFLHP